MPCSSQAIKFNVASQVAAACRGEAGKELEGNMLSLFSVSVVRLNPSVFAGDGTQRVQHLFCGPLQSIWDS